MFLCAACVDPNNRQRSPAAAKVKIFPASSTCSLGSEARFALSHARASSQHKSGWGGNTWRVLLNDYRQAGERCGPIITLETIDRIIASEPATVKMMDQRALKELVKEYQTLKADGAGTNNAHLQRQRFGQLTHILTEQKKMRVLMKRQQQQQRQSQQGGQPQQLREDFKKASLETLMNGIAGQTAPGSPQLLKLTNLYKKILPTAQVRRDDDCKRTIKRKVDKQLEKAAAKRQKYETSMNALRELLGDVWWGNLAFESYLFKRLTAGFDSAPSQCTPQRLHAVANKLAANFSLLPMEFLDGSFFGSHDERDPPDAFETAFRSLHPVESEVRKKLKTLALCQLGTVNNFTELIENRQLKEAVLCGHIYCKYNYSRPCRQPGIVEPPAWPSDYSASMPGLFEAWHFSTFLKPRNDFFPPCDMWNALSDSPPPDLSQFKTMYNPTLRQNHPGGARSERSAIHTTTSDVVAAYDAIPALFHCASALHELATSFFDHSFLGDTLFERKFPPFYFTRTYHVPSLPSITSPSFHSTKPGVIRAAAQKGATEGAMSKELFLKNMSKEIFLQNVHKPIFAAALECGQFKEAFWFGWLMHAQISPETLPRGGRRETPYLRKIFPEVLRTRIPEDFFYGYLGERGKYLDMVLNLAVLNDDAFAEARALKEALCPFTPTTLAEAYEAFPGLQLQRIFNAHDALQAWRSGAFLRGSFLGQAAQAAVPHDAHLRYLLTDMVCKPPKNSGAFYALVLKGLYQETLLLHQGCLQKAFSTALIARARGRPHFTHRSNSALALLWEHLVRNDTKFHGLKKLTLQNPAPCSLQSFTVECGLIPKLFQHGFFQYDKGVAAGQEYARLDWIEDAELKATVKSHACWVDHIRRSGTMAHSNNGWTSNNNQQHVYCSNFWAHLLAHRPDFESLIRHDERKARRLTKFDPGIFPKTSRLAASKEMQRQMMDQRGVKKLITEDNFMNRARENGSNCW
jgi:hypothetical protein